MSATTVPLRRFGRVVNGGTPTPAPENWGGDIAWATPVDLARVDGGFLATTDRTLTDVGLAQGSSRVPTGSVLLSTRAPIGYVAVAAAPMAFNQGCKAVVARSGVDARYLRYVLQARKHDLQAQGSGSTFLELSNEALLRTPVPDVGPEEQRRIADFLDEHVARIDQIIAARDAMSLNIDRWFEARRRAAILGLDAGPRRRTLLPWAPEVGDTWKTRRLAHLARMGTGHTPSRSEPDYWIDCDIPWLTTSDVHRFRRDEIDSIHATEINISAVGLANSAAVLHRAGTVALSRTASAGFSIIMETDMATSQDFVTWTPTNGLRSRFLLHVVRVMRPYLLGNLAMGSTHKTIYFPDLMDITIPIPPEEVQAAAEQQVERASEGRLNSLQAINSQVNRLQEYKQSLITAAVTGEIDVTTASTRIPGE